MTFKFMRLKDCHNFQDFRTLAKKRLPSPIFNYIDGGSDDETTYRRNTAAFETCDLIPSVLAGVKDVDLSVTVMGQKLAMPVYCSPTALQRLFHHQGERAVAGAAEKYGTMFGVSSLGTVSMEEMQIGEPEEEEIEEPEYSIEDVKAELKNLPQGYRTILSLYLFEGYDHEEIGEVLNISSSTSRSQYLRAKKKLIEQIKNQAYVG